MTKEITVFVYPNDKWEVRAVNEKYYALGVGEWPDRFSVFIEREDLPRLYNTLKEVLDGQG